MIFKILKFMKKKNKPIQIRKKEQAEFEKMLHEENKAKLKK